MKALTSESKSSVSLGTTNDDTRDISDGFDTIVKRNRKKTTRKNTSKQTISGKKKHGGTTRRTWPLDQEKRLKRQFREEIMQGRLPGRAVCLEAVN